MILVTTMAIHVQLISEPLPFLIPPTPPLLPGELVTWGREQVSEQSHNSSVYGSPCLPQASSANYPPSRILPWNAPAEDEAMARKVCRTNLKTT